jgi:hypothetical protein
VIVPGAWLAVSLRVLIDSTAMAFTFLALALESVVDPRLRQTT